MGKLNQKKILIASLIITTIAITILLTAGFVGAKRDTEKTPETNSAAASEWTIKIFGESLALYENGKVDTVYGEIVLDNLPAADKEQLSSGRSFASREEAERALEDYQ